VLNPNISRTLPRSITSRGDPPFLSTHFVKSPSFTSCSTRTSVTDTFTNPMDCSTPATHSRPRIAANPCATASYNVLAVTSTVCATPSKSCIVTRQDRIAINAKYHIRFLFAMGKHRQTGSQPSKSPVARWADNGDARFPFG